MNDIKIWAIVTLFSVAISIISRFVLRVKSNLNRGPTTTGKVFEVISCFADILLAMAIADVIIVAIDIKSTTSIAVLAFIIAIIFRNLIVDLYKFVAAMVSVSIMRKEIKTISSTNGSGDLIIEKIKYAYNVCHRNYGLFYEISTKRFDKLMNEFNVYQVNGLPEFKIKSFR